MIRRHAGHVVARRLNCGVSRQQERTNVFDLLPGQYAISDESDIRDFTDMGSSDTSDIWTRIKAVYAVDTSDVTSGRLLDIFAQIARRRGAH